MSDVQVVTPVYSDLSDEVKAMIESAPNQRVKVKALIECGTFTKADMSALLDMTVQSISSQMTYLRLSGLFTKYDENRVYSLCTEEEFNEWSEARASASKKESTKTPIEQANSLAKSIQRQKTQLTNLEAKLPTLSSAPGADVDGELAKDALDEAKAKITLLEIGLRRTKAKLDIVKESLDKAPGIACDEEASINKEDLSVIDEAYVEDGIEGDDLL